MYKILLTADIHWGLLNKDEDSLWALNTMENYAIQNGIEHAFILGDLFHNRLILDIISHHKIVEFFKASKLHWVVFPGNHDLPRKNTWKITALNTIQNVNVVLDISKIKIENLNFWILPFIKNDELYMKAAHEINQEASEEDILLTHVAVNKAIRNVCYMDQYGGSIDLSNTKFKYIFAGHFHNHQKIQNFYYVGSPIPFRFDEGLVKHGFMTLDSNFGVEFIDLYEFEGHPPYYLSIYPDDIENVNVEGNNIRIIFNSDEYDINQDEIKKTLKEKGALSIKTQNNIIEKTKITNQNVGGDLLSLSEAYINETEFDDTNKELLIQLNREILND
jgi:DNA repair exonuclease SbcCD nuclease subunit